MSDLVGGGGACDVPQHGAKGPGDVYRSAAIKLRCAVARAPLPLEMANAFYPKWSACAQSKVSLRLDSDQVEKKKEICPSRRTALLLRVIFHAASAAVW
jgi:hypothetical protein